jgi:hypothetical protein
MHFGGLQAEAIQNHKTRYFWPSLEHGNGTRDEICKYSECMGVVWIHEHKILSVSESRRRTLRTTDEEWLVWETEQRVYDDE